MPVDQRPNILLVLTDQHRLSALGCYGQTSCRTPNLDRLAHMGLRFETAYTPCPLCSPACAGVVAEMRERVEAWMVETRYPGLSMCRRSCPRRLGPTGANRSR